jgi:hypothetical protein
LAADFRIAAVDGRRCPIRSMREQTADRTVSEQAARDPAKDPFSQPGVSVAASYDQIGSLISRKPEKFVGDGRLGVKTYLCGNDDLMAQEIVGEVIDILLAVFGSSVAHFDNHYFLCITQKWNCVANGAA